MFVQSNSLRKMKDYFHGELKNYSNSEVNLIVKSFTCKCLNISESDYLISDDMLLSESDLLYFKSCLKRLKNNEPFQYILGSVEFYGLELNIDYRALIPRPETEELVDWVVSSFNGKQNLVFLDLCAGSGCIPLALKSAFKYAEVFVAEFSKEAISLMNENAALTGLEIQIKEMDVLDYEHYRIFKENSFDCWVSNPPYIPITEKAFMEKNVLEHEPHIALFIDDADPFIFYRAIAFQATKFLKDQGYLFFEIHEDFSEAVITLLKDFGFVNIELRKDLQGRNRMVKAQNVFSRYESK